MSIEKILVCSTGHVSEKTAAMLPDGIPGLIAYEKGEYGWLIYTKNIRFDWPRELAALLLHAEQQDCVWLMLDNAADVLPNFPTYEW